MTPPRCSGSRFCRNGPPTAGAPVRAGVAAAAVAALCLLAFAGGEAGLELLRYERAAVLERGQWWRLISGQFVHLGAAHLAGNLAAWVLLVALCVTAPGLRAVLLGGAGGLLGTGLGLLLLAPSVHWYAGLSGALHGVAVGAALTVALARPLPGIALLAVIVAKLVVETAFGGLPGTPALPDGARVVTEAHLWGGVGGGVAIAIAVVLARGRADGAGRGPQG